MIGPRGPFIKIMQRIVLVLLFLSFNLSAAEAQQVLWEPTHGTLLNIKSFDETFVIESSNLPDLILKDEKINACIVSYIEKQSKSYSKIVQQNLYDLIHNFDNITAKIQGKKPIENNKLYDKKIEALAKVQCELYNTLNVIK